MTARPRGSLRRPRRSRDTPSASAPHGSRQPPPGGGGGGIPAARTVHRAGGLGARYALAAGLGEGRGLPSARAAGGGELLLEVLLRRFHRSQSRAVRTKSRLVRAKSSISLAFFRWSSSTPLLCECGSCGAPSNRRACRSREPCSMYRHMLAVPAHHFADFLASTRQTKTHGFSRLYPVTKDRRGSGLSPRDDGRAGLRPASAPFTGPFAAQPRVGVRRDQRWPPSLA